MRPPGPPKRWTAGYSEVLAYEDGMKGWIAAGNEIETGERSIAR
jgi:hypothetical protein